MSNIDQKWSKEVLTALDMMDMGHLKEIHRKF